MEYSIFGDWETFMHDVGEERIFQMNVYKRLYTPYEIDKKFMDESIYEDSTYTSVIIRESVFINDDIFLGLQVISDEDDLDQTEYSLVYYFLSDIHLDYIPSIEKQFFIEDDNNEIN